MLQNLRFEILDTSRKSSLRGVVRQMRSQFFRKRWMRCKVIGAGVRMVEVFFFTVHVQKDLQQGQIHEGQDACFQSGVSV